VCKSVGCEFPCEIGGQVEQKLRLAYPIAYTTFSEENTFGSYLKV
jgi:hypothetical protein